METKLKAYFGSESDLNKFTLTAKRIVQSLAQLLEEQGRYVCKSHQVKLEFLRRLVVFD